MADLTALRKSPRAILNETTVIGRGCRGYVLPEISAGRSHFIKDTFGSAGSLNGAAPDEGPASTTWTSTNLTKSGGTLGLTAAGNGYATISSGSADGFISFTVITSGTPATDGNTYLFFRCTSTTTFTLGVPNAGWALRIAPGSDTGEFLLNGVAVGTTFTIGAGFATAGVLPVEVRLSGSTIECWTNGVLRRSVTNTGRQTDTYVGVGITDGATDATLDDFFFASVPTCPFGAGGRGTNSGNYPSTRLTLDAGVAAGALLPLHFRWARYGTATLITAANKAYTFLYDDAVTLINSPTPALHNISGDNGYIGPSTIGAYATSTGLVGGAARIGTFRFRVGQVQDAGLDATKWTSDSENLATALPSGVAGSSHDYGAGYASVSVAVSSIQAPASLVAYNETATEGLTLASFPWRTSATPTIQPRQAGVNVTSKGGAGSTWASGVSSRSDTMDKNFLRSSSGVQLRITMAAQSTLNSDPAILLNGAPPTGYQLTTSPTNEAGSTIVETAGDTAWTADPRLTVYHLLLLNDNTYATPPTSEDTIPKNRLTADLAFVAARVRNANAVGQNGITWTRFLRDAGNLVADVINDSVVTATAGGQAGWDPALAVWDEGLPGGGWTHRRTITAPTGATGADMLVGADATFTLLAPNPSLRVVTGGGAYGATADKDHWHPGDALLVGLALINTTTGLIIAPDTGTATMYVGRFNQTLGRAEYLDSDFTWKALSTTVAAYAWPLAASAGDPNVFIKVFTAAETAAFTAEDLHLIGNVKQNSTPYSGPGYTPTVGTANGHGGYQLDPVALALSGVVSYR